MARQTGLLDDLEAVFADSPAGTAQAVLTLAIYLVATGRSFDRVARWQRIAKAPCGTELTPKRITRLTQSITDGRRMALLRRRSRRSWAGSWKSPVRSASSRRPDASRPTRPGHAAGISSKSPRKSQSAKDGGDAPEPPGGVVAWFCRFCGSGQ